MLGEKYMKTIKDISKINLHDAKVESITVENDSVYFNIPNGLNNDIDEQNIKSCRLRFKLVNADEAKITYSKFLHSKFFRKFHKNIFYKTVEMLSLTELSKLIDKTNGFELINWYFDKAMNYVNLDCFVKNNEPLRIELDILDCELIVD